MRQATSDRIDYLPFQEPQIAQRFPEVPRQIFETSVQLIETDGSVYGGAEAIFRAVADEKPWLLGSYQKVPGFAPISERVYRFVAEHRTFASTLSRALWGESFERPSYVWVRWLFLRSMALIYLIAFVSLWTQIDGLAGRNGIMPAAEIMQAAREQTAGGLDRFRVVPTLCWISASDFSLRSQCAAGMVLGILLSFGVAPALCLALLWVLYLSLSTVCPVFLAFQWDNLLLETGLLAIFFAPLSLLPGRGCPTPLSTVMLWLLRWLLFRLMFASGFVKLLSGDLTWQNLTALNFHYETQPLPTWIGWYAHQLPQWAQKGSVLGMFGIELFVPFLIFLPRRARLLAFWPLTALQLAIALTGNYGFFNLLTLALCLLLLDDRALLRVLPERWRKAVWEGRTQFVWTANREATAGGRRMRRCHGGLVVVMALLVLSVSTVELLSMFRFRGQWLSPLGHLYAWVAPLRSVNSYGLFAVMTTSRLEIGVQGSNDGQNWLEYEFKWKPGDQRGRPAFVAPHMPRLDWQMWFAALGTYQHNQWFIGFCVRLLQGSPEVLKLVENNPFPNAPPTYIRAQLYEYHFTTLSERRQTGQWWRRDFKGEYCPTLSLRESARN